MTSTPTNETKSYACNGCADLQSTAQNTHIALHFLSAKAPSDSGSGKQATLKSNMIPVIILTLNAFIMSALRTLATPFLYDKCGKPHVTKPRLFHIHPHRVHTAADVT